MGGSDPFFEIFAAWLLLVMVLGASAGMWIYFTRSSQEITAMVDRFKSTVHVVKSKSSKAVLYGKSFVANSPTTSEEPQLIIKA
jgi:hypothetical protein